MTDRLLALTGITKRFGSLVANDAISLELSRGEVLALLGENGAGKSTLVSILFGHYVADAGTIEILGRALPPGDPAAALAAGIGMVHQHSTLADNLSVLDNVMLGTEPLWWPRSRRREARGRLLGTARRFGLAVDPDARVASLSVGERQRVEILKALYRDARVLILDEPTAVLTPQESEALFATLRGMVAEGLSVIFISHKLGEVLRVSDRIAVLRAGRLVATLPARGTSTSALAEAMVGRAIAPPVARPHARGDVVCVIDRVSTRGVRASARLDAVSLALHAGEITAIAGVAGNGQAALVELLCGLRAADAGTVTLAGRPMAADPRAWIAAGAARIPEDRRETGTIGDLPVWENAIAERYRRPFASGGIVRRSAARSFAAKLVDRYDVRGGGIDTPVRALSGGNMQKLIIGRALSGGAARPDQYAPTLVVASQPTWGLDAGAVAWVHQRMLDACARGAAVLLVSEDLDEIFALADRIAVLHAGRLTPARPAKAWTLAGLGLAMAGAGTRDAA
ncbi:Galactose/methyl galactoside import ATP-binding protein MglA [Burkholderiales bacterium]|nr:Galactose/methyl galactoside import ATP-binding protein MglA [Burkholderiales bacterium]